MNKEVVMTLLDYFTDGEFDVGSLKKDLSETRYGLVDYEVALNVVINNVATITTLTEEEYFELTRARFELSNRMEIYDDIYRQWEGDILESTLLIHLMCEIHSFVNTLDEVLNKVDTRLEGSEFPNAVCIDLIKTVWDRYDHSLMQFSYTNLTEQARIGLKQPWLVIDTVTDRQGVCYISSFKTKSEAMRYLMSKGLARNTLVCRHVL